MNQLTCNDIRIEYDGDSQGYYIIWQPLTAIGVGRTKRAALEDLRAAAHFGINTMVDIKMGEIGADLSVKEAKSGG